MVAKFPFLSVIIPTRDRLDLLMRTVAALLTQASDIENQMEIVVIDDGSIIDITNPLMNLAILHNQKNLVRVLHQSPEGPAAARNLGIREAKGEIILFLGDDILASPGLLRAHLTGHIREYSKSHYAILGMAELAPELQNTPFVRWWKRWNFRYWLLLEKRRSPDYSFFYTNNLSLKRSFLLQYGSFDETFRYPAYEDSELGVRLFKNGLQLIFMPEAHAEHWHEINLQSACRRMVTRGKTYDLFVAKTNQQGISRIWMILGTGPWMTPTVIRPLFKLANWLQTKAICSPVYIMVLMYNFQVGRGKKSPINEIA
jgi:glycosyltransferase involved in cell wall biosynthesis